MLVASVVVDFRVRRVAVAPLQSAVVAVCSRRFVPSVQPRSAVVSQPQLAVSQLQLAASQLQPAVHQLQLAASQHLAAASQLHAAHQLLAVADVVAAAVAAP
jgi:hypothetical protein